MTVQQKRCAGKTHSDRKSLANKKKERAVRDQEKRGTSAKMKRAVTNIAPVIR